MRLKEPLLAPRQVAVTLLLIQREIHPRLAREQLQRLAKVQPLYFHNKAKDIAAPPTTKIMPNILLGAHKKARRPLTGKGAQTFVTPPRPLKLHILAHHILYIQACPHLFFGIHRYSIPH